MRLGGLGVELTQQSAAGQNEGHHVKKERGGTWGGIESPLIGDVGGHRKPPDRGRGGGIASPLIFHLPEKLVPRKKINKFKKIKKSMKKREERVFSWIF